MALIRSRTIVLGSILAVVSVAAQPRAACQTGKGMQGLPNFGRVTDTVYRGGQPTLAGFSALQAMGVGMVVNFRDERGEMATEKRQVEALGIEYVEIPWNGRDKPSSAQVVQFLDLVRANPQTKIFVHCKRGADRTGVMVAAYRIAVERKSVGQAVSEMHQFHYDWLFLPQLERYVKSLPELLQKDALFAAYTSLPSPVAGSTLTSHASGSVVPAQR